jgi:iron complex outermembrane receptor protein
MSPEMTLSLSIARSFRAPTVQELFANGLDAASSTYSKGDAGLTPETGFGIDASFKARTPFLLVEISPYANFINDYIYAFLTGDTLENFPVRHFSATNARLMGFEAGITVEPVARIAVRGTVDYVNAEDTKNSVPLPFTPPLRGLLSVKYQDEVYSAVLEWRLAAAQTRLGDGDTPTAGYGLLNCGAGIRLASGRLVHALSVRCDNLLNRAYRDNLSVIKDFLPQPARSFRLAYDLLF